MISLSFTEEYCENDVLEAECPPDHVVVIETAHYGRMRFGRCVDRDYGYLGCQSDVLHVADRWCSGRRKCTIPVPNSHFGANSPCPRDLKPYLDANYTCVKSKKNENNLLCKCKNFISVILLYVDTIIIILIYYCIVNLFDCNFYILFHYLIY